MIDRNRRDYYARLLKNFLNGRISEATYNALTSRFDKAYKKFKLNDSGMDMALLYVDGIFIGIDSIKDFRKECEFSNEDLECFSKILLFLKTDLEYEWIRNIQVYPNKLENRLRSIFTPSVFAPKYMQLYNAQGDKEVWPFLRRDDYENALKEHKEYLLK